jgi:hypothetical protein
MRFANGCGSQHVSTRRPASPSRALRATDALAQNSAETADLSAQTITLRAAPLQRRHAASDQTGFPSLKAWAHDDIQKGISREWKIDQPGLSNNRFRSWLASLTRSNLNRSARNSEDVTYSTSNPNAAKSKPGAN